MHVPHFYGYLKESTWDFVETKTSVKVVLDGVALLLRARREGNFLPELARIFALSLRDDLEIVHFSVFEFQRGLQPKLLFRDGDDAIFDADLTKYLNGMYLLDPLYDLYVNQEKTGTFHFCADTRGELDAEPYYDRYWRFIGLKNEIGALYEIAPDRCIHVSIQFSGTDEQAAARAVEFTTASEKFFIELFTDIFAEAPPADDEDSRRDVHGAVSEALRDFGSETLTGREQEIAQLMLKGHSAKMIAHIAGISPGTASIHRSNIYRKMDVTSVGDLFGVFLAKLTTPKQ